MRRVALVICSFLTFAGCGLESNQIHLYNVGDRVQTGTLIYTAVESHWFTSLGQPSTPRYPTNRFLIVRLAITNSGATDTTVPTLMLISDSGQTFNELSDGSGVPDWMGVVRKIKPVEHETGVVAFDVPPGHYRLRVADEMDQIVEDIDLPLNVLSDEKG